MLRHLVIHNYAIINELEIDFSTGMNVITGETGAGKSIIIGALNLILGERADTTVLVNKEKKCIIEGVFEPVQKERLVQFFTSNDLDYQTEITVRREIAVSGKTRAFINDTPVTLSQMQQLSSLLVDLHRQFDTLAIADNDFQINVLDALAGNSELLKEYQHQYKNWQKSLKELSILKEQQEQFQKESDYNQFLYDELNEADFHENELEEAEEEIKLLSNAEEIKSALNKVSYELNEGEQPIVQQLKNLTNQLRSFTGYHKDLANLSERLSSAQIEIRDIAGEVESINNQIHYYPEKIEKLNDRISQGYKLQKKHGVHSTAELLQIQKHLEEKLYATLHIADDIEILKRQTDEMYGLVVEIAAQISKARKGQISPFEKQANKLLAQVGMPNAAIKVALTGKEPGVNGMDDIEFLFDANKSGQYKPVSKVASGGELSRLMLCIKSLVAKSMDMPTLIFDEIDTGISGEAARQVGIIMKELAQNRQIICITHQPQIAGKANAHFFVYKEPENNVITTNIRLLDNDERITTIAKMLSGEKPTAAALQNAREMVQN